MPQMIHIRGCAFNKQIVCLEATCSDLDSTLAFDASDGRTHPGQRLAAVKTTRQPLLRHATTCRHDQREIRGVVAKRQTDARTLRDRHDESPRPETPRAWFVL